jgi:hypothetical protein
MAKDIQFLACCIDYVCGGGALLPSLLYLFIFLFNEMITQEKKDIQL